MNLIHFMQPLETMKHISRQEFVENLDEVIATANNDNVGFVITDNGKDDLVLCPAKWFDIYYDDDFGCMINSAIRYSLGRSSYMPDIAIRFVLKHLSVLDTRTITVMIRDIERELADDQLPYRDDWIILKNALEEHFQKMRDKGGVKSD